MVDTVKKVLVIDDEDNMRHMLSILLTGQGYAVETASDGLAGLKLLIEQSTRPPQDEAPSTEPPNL